MNTPVNLIVRIQMIILGSLEAYLLKPNHLKQLKLHPLFFYFSASFYYRSFELGGNSI